jgi:hypothetical protein
VENNLHIQRTTLPEILNFAKIPCSAPYTRHRLEAQDLLCPSSSYAFSIYPQLRLKRYEKLWTFTITSLCLRSHNVARSILHLCTKYHILSNITNNFSVNVLKYVAANSFESSGFAATQLRCQIHISLFLRTGCLFDQVYARPPIRTFPTSRSLCGSCENITGYTLRSLP